MSSPSTALPYAPATDLESALLAAVRARASTDSAHDLAHVLRVTASAQHLALAEGAEREVCVAAALCHELLNLPKGHPESHRSGELCAGEAEALLRATGYSQEHSARAAEAIRTHSWSRGLPPGSLEAAVLQDADRLDAVGALGVARCFATCQQMGRPLYHPEDPFCVRREPEDKLWGVDHFYKKLLRIPHALHTPAARALVQPRRAVMHDFLRALAAELGHPEPPLP